MDVVVFVVIITLTLRVILPRLFGITRTIEMFPFLTEPQLQRDDQFYLKTQNGDYVSVCNSCAPIDQNLANRCTANLCVKEFPVRSSVFTYLPHRDGTFSVRTWDGKYWKRCDNCFERCPNIVCADGVNYRLQPAKFELIKSGDDNNSISIKTDTGRLLELVDCDQSCGRIIAAIGVGNNKDFIIEKLPPPYKPPVRIRQRTRKFVAPSYAPLSIPFQD